MAVPRSISGGSSAEDFGGYSDQLVIAFSVLAQGLLTDRYLNGILQAQGSLGGSLSRDILNEEPRPYPSPQ
jgi:hypothetical protein